LSIAKDRNGSDEQSAYESTIITSSKNSLIIMYENTYTDDILSRKTNDNHDCFQRWAVKRPRKNLEFKKKLSSKKNSQDSLFDRRQTNGCQYSRPKEIASSMEVNIPSSIRSIRYCVHRACMYILYWGVHDTRSWPIAFVEHAKHMIDIWH